MNKTISDHAQDLIHTIARLTDEQKRGIPLIVTMKATRLANALVMDMETKLTSPSPTPSIGLTLQKSDALEDWYIIERADVAPREWIEKDRGGNMHYRTNVRLSDADIEGTAGEMDRIMFAIEERSYASFRRCAVDARQEPVKLWSPRNSTKIGEIDYTSADHLAREIRRVLELPH